MLRYKERVKRHFESYRLIGLQLSTMGCFDIDDFETEIIKRVYSSMVVTEKVNYSQNLQVTWRFSP